MMEKTSVFLEKVSVLILKTQVFFTVFLFFDATYIISKRATPTLSVCLPCMVLQKLLGFKLSKIGEKPSPLTAMSSGPG